MLNFYCSNNQYVLTCTTINELIINTKTNPMKKLILSSILLLALSLSFTSCRDVKEKAEGATDAVENAADAATDAAGDAVDSAKEAAGDAVEGAKEAAGNAVEGAKEAAGDAVEGAKDMA